ncbi:MAG: holo-ACP synthase [Candidatus Firestonebacteria bacterium]
MDFKFGIDIVEIKRIKNLINKRKNFISKVFTKKEITYCRSKKNPCLHFASRFAAKEAFLKAVSSGWQGKLKWKDIEVYNDKFGKPMIFLLSSKYKFIQKIKDIELTISQDKSHAIAFVAIRR